MPAGGQAGIVSRNASTADLGPHVINAARRGNTDLAGQGGATVTVAAHPPGRVVEQLGRNAGDRLVVFEGQPRPFARIGATGAAGPAIRNRGIACRRGVHYFFFWALAALRAA